MAFYGVSLLLGSMAAAVSGRHLRVYPPPIVNPDLANLNTEATQAKLLASGAAAATAVHQAQAAAARSGTSVMYVEQMNVGEQTKTADLKSMLASATARSAGAVKSVADTNRALKEVEAIAKAAPEQAKTLAVAEVQKFLITQYHELDEWRNKVLADPSEKARKAGAVAAEPYYKMVDTFYKRIQAYQAEAGSLAGQANNAAAGARAMSSGAEARIQGGDVIGGNQDYEMAKAIATQGRQLAGAAGKYQAEAVRMNKLIPQYLANAHAAAIRAGYEANIDAVPPPPLNPNFAFTPPPPAAGPAPAAAL